MSLCSLKIPLLILKLFNFPACLCKPVCWSYSDSFRTVWNVPRPCWDGLSCCRAFQRWSLAGKVRHFGSASRDIKQAWLLEDLQVFFLWVEGFTLFIFHETCQLTRACDFSLDLMEFAWFSGIMLPWLNCKPNDAQSITEMNYFKMYMTNWTAVLLWVGVVNQIS